VNWEDESSPKEERAGCHSPNSSFPIFPFSLGNWPSADFNTNAERIREGDKWDREGYPCDEVHKPREH